MRKSSELVPFGKFNQKGNLNMKDNEKDFDSIKLEFKTEEFRFMNKLI